MHFMSTARCSVQGKPLSGSLVTSGSDCPTDTRTSPPGTILLSAPKQTQPHMKLVGLKAHRLSSSTTVRFLPNIQVPFSRDLNCISGRPERLVDVDLATLLSID